MRVVVFAGPSLPPSARPSLEGVSWRPPARQGDLYRAALEKPDVIGLVDGYFETVPSVWHKEILWALSEGIQVFGSSSVGALRAVELAPFGMRGVGKVFEDFRDGILQDDDEVALLHAPEELDYAPLSEPMVNMRATVARAVRAGIVDGKLAIILVSAAKTLFYKQRSWEAAAALLSANPLDSGDRMRVVSQVLHANRVDQKRVDAIAMIEQISRANDQPGMPAQFSMARSDAWLKAATTYTRRRGPRKTDPLPL